MDDVDSIMNLKKTICSKDMKVQKLAGSFIFKKA